MAERFLFFNSAPTDPRKYQAQDFAEYFGSVLSSGLLHTDNVPGLKAAVEAGTLNTIVSPGKAVLRGHLYENTTPLTLEHDLPETSLDRIDRIVLRLNLNNAVRDIKLHILTGVPASVPVAPTLTRTPFIYEISLAQVFVRKNTVQLLPTDLVDERLDEQLCGLVYSLISIPTDQLQAFITAKRTELNDEMTAALDAFLASLAAAEQKLQADLIAWNQQWTDWFTEIQGASFVTGAEFAAHRAEKASASKLGHVIVDGETITIDASGKIKATYQGEKETTANYTVHVDGVGGSDSNVGSVSSPFKTIQKAINSLPKIIKHVVTISVASGIYNEAVKVENFRGTGRLLIRNSTSSENATLVDYFYIKSNACAIEVSYFKQKTTPDTSFSFGYAENCSEVSFSKLVAVGITAGIRVVNISFATVSDCTFSNNPISVIKCDKSSNITTNLLKGSGNGTAYDVSTFSNVYVNPNNTLVATTMDRATSGGAIIR